MYEAYLFKVTNGAIGPRINFKSLTWSISLNETESCSIDVTKTDLPSLDLNYWLSPWWAGILVTWRSRPIFAGPIVSRPTESFNTIRVECKGIRALLERRFVIHEMSNFSSDLSRDKYTIAAKDHATAAQLVVKAAMAKPGGSLPISFPYAEKSTVDDKEHETVFDGYDLGNVNANAALSMYSNKTNGPDIMFRPRLIDGNSLVWDMMRGIDESSPHIPQTNTPSWDTTATNGSVTDLDVVTTGTYLTNRMFTTGADTNELMLMNVAIDSDSLSRGFPLLEGFKALGSVADDDAKTLAGAKAALEANKQSLTEIQLSVRVDGENELGTFWPGDLVELYVKGWLSLKDGKHRLRLLNISGSSDGDVRMSLQTEK